MMNQTKPPHEPLSTADSTNRWRNVLLIMFSALLLAIVLHASRATIDVVSANEPTNGELFVDAGIAWQRSPDEPTMMRGRLVHINFELLRQDNRSVGVSEVSQKLELNLFEGVHVTALLDRIESNPSGSYTWMGKVEGVAYSQVILVVKDEVMVGKVAMPTAIYEVRYAGDELHEVVQINQAAFPDLEDDTVVFEDQEATTSRREEFSRSDDGSVIDVLVVYTAEAKTGAGGTTTAIENLIELAVSETNQSYQNSQVNQRIFLVHMAEVDYAETNDSDLDLGRLRDTDDGFMDEVHTLRDSYHADNVMLITEQGDCGLAAVQRQAPDPSFAASAFGIGRRDCTMSNLTLAHELGHHMGLLHDWYIDDGVNPFTYAHGYVNNDSNAPWRTVMGYDDLCEDQGFDCTRLAFFSNPNLTIDEVPMGVESGTASNCVEKSLAPNPSTCDADNHSVLNATASTVAQFRTSSTTWLGNSSQWASSNNWSTGVEPRFMDDVIIPASPSGGNFPTLNGTIHIRDVIIESGATLNMSGGTLNLYGDWEEEGTAQFNGNGGTVIFKGSLDQTILMKSASHFNHLQLGDGTGTQQVTLLSNLDVDGNLEFMAGITFQAGSYTIYVGGNWSDQGNGFVPATSTVVFDGSDQHVSKVTSRVVMSQDFSYRDGSSGFADILPTNWTIQDDGNGTGDPSARWRFGDSQNKPNNPYSQGFARRWYDQTATLVDAWLFTPQLSLDSDATYQLRFNYGVSNTTDPQDFAVHYGNDPTSGEMSTRILALTDIRNDSWNTATVDFTVQSNGSYHLGIRNHDTAPGTARGGLDDITLTAIQNIKFYNLTVNSTGDGVSFSGDLLVKNDLSIGANGLTDLGSHKMSVEGTVTNNGGLQQSQEISDGSGATTYEFLSIKNAAGSQTKYYGVDMTPDGGSALGSTSVRILGNHYCTDNQADPIIYRCFEITPQNSNSATIKYWFSEAERNAQAANGIKIWDHNGTQWAQVGQNGTYGSRDSTCTSDATCWYQWTNVNSFSPMVGGSGNAPTGNPASSTILTPTPTPTNTPTNTPTSTPSPTPSATRTATQTPTSTPSPTPSATRTATQTPTSTLSPTPSATAQNRQLWLPILMR
ncbi:MAG: reprolysin-like metallopeptidase [Ardenticatenaceae bacterium]